MAETGTITKKLKRDWVKALRSGKYRQGPARLRNPATSSYCCLGVLCEVAQISRYQNARTLDGSARLRALRDSLGLGTSKNGQQKKLIELNDDTRLSFKQIATWIEKHVIAR